MANWDLPQKDDPNHVDVLADLADKDTYSGTMGQNGGSFDNRPEGFMLWDNVAKVFRRLTSSIEAVVKLSIAGGGTGGGTAAEARQNLGVLEAGTGDAQVKTNAQNNLSLVPQGRQINTTGLLTGGGSLDSDLTLNVPAYPSASPSQAGIVQLNNTLTSESTAEALTAAQGKALNDKLPYENVISIDMTGSGSFTGGTITVSRIGNIINISGVLSHSSSNLALSEIVLPSWAIPSQDLKNAYSVVSVGREMTVLDYGRILFEYSSSQTSTSRFTITYNYS